MIAQFCYRLLLRRPFFKGQDRIFGHLFKSGSLKHQPKIAKPLQGNFKVKCDTSTWIGAKIFYTGDYERELKKVFKNIIKPGDHVLDIGANIGFHTLYFAELVGENGTVTAFEPVPYNYASLDFNIKLNNFAHIATKNIALSNKNEQLQITADINSKNPGAFNLFDRQGETLINCFIGDEVLKDSKVDFIKIDVEGYESFVIEGLLQTIKNNRPKIVFEYDKHFHKKTGLPENHIFSLLAPLDYQFFYLNRKGLKKLVEFKDLKSGNILAVPNG